MSYIQTFIFGITLAISIGPIAILILNQGINCGLRNGALCGLGAATADVTYAIVAFTIGGLLIPLIENQKEIIPIVSSAVLVTFGLWMIYTTFKKQSFEKKGKYSLTCKYPFITTYGLTIANPLTIVVFAGFAGLLTSDGEANILIHALIIFIASLLVQMLIAFAGSKLATFFSRPKTLLYFNLASAFGIMLLGISKLL
jgi:threonine/homoserine/homoserine lactone efflux protein